MKQKIQSVKGMNDLLPDQTSAWHYVENAMRNVAWSYGYQEIRTPMLERTALFQQSIGDQTDIVEKEMYTFVDSGEEMLSLRPEATASTVRACNQHGLLHNTHQRLWYMGPMFRRERPQRGRYRQFHQFGIEAFGWLGPDIDAEVIRIGARIWKEMNIEGMTLLVNTLGNQSSRDAYRNALHQYLDHYRGDLDDDSLRRLDKNPLRILDSKVESTQLLLKEAPSLHDHLDADAKAHFERLCSLLDDAGITPVISQKLVRGLDYYTSTVFEWVTDQLGSQSAVCAGGRYDGLVELRGGKPTPAIGFALGMERMVELIAMQNEHTPKNEIDVYVIQLSDAAISEATRLSEKLRDSGLRVVSHCGGGKMKNQMKKADQSGARIAAIFGDDEQVRGVAQIKLLRDSGIQREVPLNTLVDWCKDYLG
ncbi:MAG: histidine--tRNA ligase [Gammaproteobacteria bacterium]|nr:histidine--tRNA ligase [Gammaproteobacteria bacterium]